LLFASAAIAADSLVYAGAYTTGASRGIYGYRLDLGNGRLKTLGLVATASNPSFLVEHPDHRFLYAASEDATSMLSAYLIDPKSGKLSPVNQVLSKGVNPCHLAIDRSGRWLAAANCGSGSVSLVPLRKDGGLGETRAVPLPAGAPADGPKQLEAHADCVVFSPDNRYLAVSDEGLDRIVVYRFDPEAGSLTPADPPFFVVSPGSGVGHLAFHPNGRFLYAVNNIRQGVTAYRFDPANGSIEELQTLAPQTSQRRTSAAEIAVNAAGTMVYASNGAANSMALLVVDPVRFTLSVLEFTPLIGQRPSSFAFDPTAAYMIVANQESNNITVYTVHPHSGQLRPVGRPTPPIQSPACVVVVPVQ